MEPPQSSSSSPARPRSDAGEQQSALHKIIHAVMTPIIFVSFIVSLAIVDLSYINLRPASSSRTWLPTWACRMLFNEQPYQHIQGRALKEQSSSSGPDLRDRNGRAWYYHTKQRKLLRMEASDAFRLRNRVLVGLAVGCLGVFWLAVLVWSWAMSRLFGGGHVDGPAGRHGFVMAPS